jgi:hypothetical protein
MVDPGTVIQLAAAVGLTPAAGKLIERAVGPALDEVGEMLRGKLKRRNQVLEKAAAGLAAVNREPREVPLRLLVPLLQQASLEDEETMQDRWAALLAHAVADSGISTPPIYVHILSQLTPSSANALDILYAVRDTDHQPESVDRHSLEVQSLVALGLVQPTEMPDAVIVTRSAFPMALTALGRAFVAACQMPVAPEEPIDISGRGD